MRKGLIVLLVILFFAFAVSSIWAGQKLSLKKSEKISKFSLGKLVQTCYGLKQVSSNPRSSEPIRLNADMPKEQCHWFDPDGPFGPEPMKCMPGAGPVPCDCAEVGLTEPRT